MKQSFKSITFTIVDIFLIYIIIGAFSIALSLIAGLACDVLALEKAKDMIFSFIQGSMFIIIPLFTWKVIKRRDFCEMGLLSLKSCSSNFIEGLILGIISITICFIVIALFGNVDISITNTFDTKNYLIYFLLFIVVGFSEEIFTRGYILSTISTGSKKSKMIAILITSIIFADLHLENNGISTLGFINICLVGILYGYMYYVTDNIWMSIGCHITWDFFQGTVFGFNVSGAKVSSIIVSTVQDGNIINGGAFGIEGSIVCTLILILQIIFIHKKYTKNSSLEQ